MFRKSSLPSKFEAKGSSDEGKEKAQYKRRERLFEKQHTLNLESYLKCTDRQSSTST